MTDINRRSVMRAGYTIRELARLCGFEGDAGYMRVYRAITGSDNLTQDEEAKIHAALYRGLRTAA